MKVTNKQLFQVSLIIPTLLVMVYSAFAVVTVTDNVQDEGLACFKIQTNTVAYFLQKSAGGFSSITDKDGNDWIGYHDGNTTGNLGGGSYWRGIPNIGGCCHPGYPNESNEGITMNTTITEQKTDYVKITTLSTDTKWKIIYEFFPSYCSFTISSINPTIKNGFWVLYEGTPGGGNSLDGSKDWFMKSDGNKIMAGNSFYADLPDPEWIAFGGKNLIRSMIFIHHKNDNIVDCYSPLNIGGTMTVFGFGRGQSSSEFLFKTTPEKFSLSFIEKTDFNSIKQNAQDILNGVTTITTPAEKFRSNYVMPDKNAAIFDLTGRRIHETLSGLKKKHIRGTFLIRDNSMQVGKKIIAE